MLGGKNETIWYIGLRFPQITEIVMLFQYSESLFYSSIKEEMAYAYIYITKQQTTPTKLTVGGGRRYPVSTRPITFVKVKTKPKKFGWVIFIFLHGDRKDGISPIKKRKKNVVTKANTVGLLQ